MGSAKRPTSQWEDQGFATIPARSASRTSSASESPHLLHDGSPVQFDRLVDYTQFGRDLLVEHPGHDQREDLCLSRDQGLEPALHVPGSGLIPVRPDRPAHRPLDRAQEFLGPTGFVRKSTAPAFMAMTLPRRASRLGATGVAPASPTGDSGSPNEGGAREQR
jgi:hypothetical protein